MGRALPKDDGKYLSLSERFAATCYCCRAIGEHVSCTVWGMLKKTYESIFAA